ncbi:MAG: hypothetical protein ACLFVU_09670 [Phycisphaerae bacterium]
MSTDANQNNLGEKIEIHLENHPREEYRDLLEQFDRTFPDEVDYRLDSQLDMDPMAETNEEQEGQISGIRARGWVDLSGDHAVVYLNPNNYADTPADELQDTAQTILRDWTLQTRRRLGLEPPMDTP